MGTSKRTRPYVLDVETTTSNKGNPFDKSNWMVLLGLKEVGKEGVCYYEDEWESARQEIQSILDNAAFLILFNAKFDLHWLRNNGFDISNTTIWDCQLGVFILGAQLNPYPSLDETLSDYGLPSKLDVVKTVYWDQGLDTWLVPDHVLSPYLLRDLQATEEVFLRQWELFKGENSKQFALFKLQCKDLLVLEEMEFNGIFFNTEKAIRYADVLDRELDTIRSDLSKWTQGISINLASNDHISCLLFGGTIVDSYRVPVGVFKTGNKVGETRYKIMTKEYEFPRLITPLAGSETKKEGYYQVNADVLNSLKPSKDIKKLIDLLNEFSKIEKLKNTYLLGWSKLITTMNWDKDMIHGVLNQCRAVTGRLSSSKPNLQNADPITKKYCETIYDSQL